MGLALFQADARRLPLPDRSVQCVITSPPYWGLRDYGIPDQIGLEPTPARYVEHLVEVFAEVRRVLKPDGTVWLNLGDSYARNGGVPGGDNRELLHLEGHQRRMLKIPEGSGLKSKDLVGMPWRVAFALQADGWYLRADIIWAKSNPLPESVTDRPTRAHEYLFLLAKEERYYYDAEAVKESRTEVRGSGNKRRLVATAGERSRINTHLGSSIPTAAGSELRNRRDVWTIATQPYRGAHFAVFPPALVEPCLLAGSAHWQQDRTRCTVLDPFCGSGTVGVVAWQQGRAFVGCDRNREYLGLARDRMLSCNAPSDRIDSPANVADQGDHRRR
jgi:DNA modification methylase